MNPNTPIDLRIVNSLDADGPALSIRYACGHVVAVSGPLAEWATCPQCALASGETMQQNGKGHRGTVDDAGGGLVVLRTSDHPGARNQLFIPEDRRCYFVKVPLDDGRTLVLEFGTEGRANFERLILDTMMRDDTGRADSVEDAKRRRR